MRIICVASFMLLLLFATPAALLDSNGGDNEVVKTVDVCNGHCFKMLQPLLDIVVDLKKTIKSHENVIQFKDAQMLVNQKKLGALHVNEEACNKKLKHKDELIATLEQKTCTGNTSTKATSLHEVDKIVANKNETNELPTNCDSLMGVNDISVPNVGRLEVLCDEDEWIVVQRRYDGGENFYRNWSEYRSGFGDRHKEFFIGLEALHQMTTSERYELYIELIDFKNYVRYARYDNFIIGSEEQSYKLRSLGTYSGTAGDALRYNLGEKFTTFDWDTDEWDGGNCANYYEGAGWYAWFANSNLFGKYFHSEVSSSKSIFWYNWRGYSAIRSVKMMIQPND